METEHSETVAASDWKWFGHAGHLIVGSDCRFHLCTLVGKFIISTVGEYWPDRIVREIHASISDPQWLAENRHLKGDNFDAAYMEKFGYQAIGAGEDSLYETMVFHHKGKFCDCGCGLPVPTDWGAIEQERAATPGEATKTHYELCAKYSKE